MLSDRYPEITLREQRATTVVRPSPTGTARIVSSGRARTTRPDVGESGKARGRGVCSEFHGAGLARSLEIGRVIIPPAAGVFSAVGLLVAKQSVTLSAAFFGALREVAIDKVNDCFGRLRNDADHLLELHDRTPTYRLDFEMRYVGQAFELTISLEAETFSEVVRQALRPRFDSEHKRRFGHSFDEANEVEIVALTVRATDPSSQVVQRFSVPGASALNFERKAYFGEKFGVMTSPVIGRGELVGKPNRGPLIIEEFEGTTVVPPDAFVHRDGADNIIIELEY